jgi:hypothetical protein
MECRILLKVTIAVVLTILLCLASSGELHAQDLPPFSLYQVQLPPSPSGGDKAIASLEERRKAVIEWNACGREAAFLNAAIDLSKDPSGPDPENLLGPIIAKVIWLHQHQGGTCGRMLTVDNGWSLRPEWWDQVRASTAEIINADFQTAFACGEAPFKAQAGPGNSPAAVTNAELSTSLTWRCMRLQVNAVLHLMQAHGQPGTKGSACYIFGSPSSGDYDITVRDLLRVLFLDTPAQGNGIVLDTPVRAHLINDLLTIDGPPLEDSYSLMECGDQEHSSGSPQERADDRNWTEDTFAHDLGDLLDWLLRRLVLLAALAVGVGVALALLGPIASSLVAVVGGLAVVGLSIARVPETENHLLMINSSRYLTNQIILEALTDDDDRGRFESYNQRTKDWLLDRMHGIARGDFIEYNAKPYQRYSLTALLNLRDFAHDHDLRTGADLLLQSAFAKAAVGSSQSRRVVPFRRLLSTEKEELEGPGTEGDHRHRRLLDMTLAADHQTAYLLTFAGQTGALPGHKASIGSIAEMIYPVSSQFVPDESLIDLAINKSKGIEQRFHHGGWEAYSAGFGYVISAGGVEAGFAYPALLGPIKIPPTIALRDKVNEDRGAALPTVLIPNGGPGSGQARTDFLRIEGPIHTYPVDNGATSFTHDHNMCVAQGFACGTLLSIPPTWEQTGCLTPQDGLFRFLDSKTCPATVEAPRFFVVLFIHSCAGRGGDCIKNFGFFEAVDAGGENFDAFRGRVKAANPVVIFDPDGSSQNTPGQNPVQMMGSYITSRGALIVFDARGHQDSAAHTGIISVNNVKPADMGHWNLAEGDTIESAGDGNIVVHNRAWKVRVTLDFSNESSPKPVLVDRE